MTAVERANAIADRYQGLRIDGATHHFLGRAIEQAIQEAEQAMKERAAQVAERDWVVSWNMRENIAAAIRALE